MSISWVPTPGCRGPTFHRRTLRLFRVVYQQRLGCVGMVRRTRTCAMYALNNMMEGEKPMTRVTFHLSLERSTHALPISNSLVTRTKHDAAWLSTGYKYF